MPSAKRLHEERLRALHDAAVRAGLTEHRDELLLGIDPSVKSSLPFAASPSARILSDLFHLADTTLRDGSLPLIPWLRNALRLLGTNEDASVIEEALHQLGDPVPERRTPPLRSPVERFADSAFQQQRVIARCDELRRLAKDHNLRSASARITRLQTALELDAAACPFEVGQQVHIHLGPEGHHNRQFGVGLPTHVLFWGWADWMRGRLLLGIEEDRPMSLSDHWEREDQALRDAEEARTAALLHEEEEARAARAVVEEMRERQIEEEHRAYKRRAEYLKEAGSLGPDEVIDGITDVVLKRVGSHIITLVSPSIFSGPLRRWLASIRSIQEILEYFAKLPRVRRLGRKAHRATEVTIISRLVRWVGFNPENARARSELRPGEKIAPSELFTEHRFDRASVLAELGLDEVDAALFVQIEAKRWGLVVNLDDALNHWLKESGKR